MEKNIQNYKKDKTLKFELFLATMKDKKSSEKSFSVIYLIQVNSIFRNHFNVCLSKRRQLRNSSTTRNTKKPAYSEEINSRVGVCPGLFANPWQTNNQNFKGSQLAERDKGLGPKSFKKSPPKLEPLKKGHYGQCLKETAVYRACRDTWMSQLYLWVESRERFEKCNGLPFLTISLSQKNQAISMVQNTHIWKCQLKWSRFGSKHKFLAKASI